MTLIYHVYILDVDIPTSEQLQLVKRFYEQKAIVDKRKVEGLPVKRVYDENDMMNFETLGEFINRKRVWPLIRNNILNNPEFYSALSSTNRKTFNMCTNK